MSLIHPQDCLSYHLSRPLLRMQSVENVPCSVFSSRMETFRTMHGGNAKPEYEALSFYQLSHALALIQQRRHPLEPLPKDELDLVNAYFTDAGTMAQRALFYLLVITTRETRHLINKSTMLPKLRKAWGDKVGSYVSSIPDGADTAMQHFIKTPPDAGLGPFVSGLRQAFYEGKWGGGYGGSAWGQVTDVAHQFAYGKFSLAMLLDRVWELCHNNGPIFNKGMLYDSYDTECETIRPVLMTILDAQRAGAVPSLIASPPYFIKQFVKGDLAERNAKLLSMFPDIPKEVDWNQVEELGSEHSYDHLKPAHQKKVAKPKVVKPKPPKAAPKDMFLVAPGVALKKIKLIRKAAA